jgi:hypothetical protein
MTKEVSTSTVKPHSARMRAECGCRSRQIEGVLEVIIASRMGSPLQIKLLNYDPAK